MGKKKVRQKKETTKTDSVAPSGVADEVIECIYTDKRGVTITLAMLEKLYLQSIKNQKSPLLIVGIKRNEDETFVIKGILKIEHK